MRERRVENRLWCADLVRVNWRYADNDAGTVAAVLEDISSTGACIQMEGPIPVGAAVAIFALEHESGREVRFSGQVSYCEYRDFGYFVGIRLAEETKWSVGMFEPLHLTDLTALPR